MSKESKVGLVALVAFIFIGIVMMVSPWEIFHKNYILVTATFSDGNGIKKDHEVLYQGVYAGRVQKVEVKDGKAVITLKIRKEMKIPVDANVKIQQDAIIGEPVVKLSGGKDSRMLKDGDHIIETKDDRVDKLIEKGNKLLDTANKVEENIEKFKK